MPPDIEIIAEPDDPRFAQFRVNERALASRAQKRDDSGAGLFLAEGDLVVERAFRAGCVPIAALVDTTRVPDVAAELGCPLFGGGPEVRKPADHATLVRERNGAFERVEAAGLVAAGSAINRLEPE